MRPDRLRLHALALLLLALPMGCGRQPTRPLLSLPREDQPTFIRRIGVEDHGFTRVSGFVLDGADGVIIGGAAGELARFDRDGQLTRVWTWPANGRGYDMRRMALAPDGALWVTGDYSVLLARLRPDGSAPLEVGAQGIGPGQFLRIADVAVGADSLVYVLDNENPRVTVFSADGVYLRHWVVACPGGCSVMSPRALTLDRAGNVYVLDEELLAVLKFAPDGSWLATLTWDDAPDALRLSYPRDLAVDGAGRIHVLTQFGYQAFTLDATGAWLETLRLAPGRISSEVLGLAPDGELYAIAGDGGGVVRMDTRGRLITIVGFHRGQTAGALSQPTALAIDAQDNLFVSDAGSGRVQEFDASGRFLRGWDSPSSYVETRDIAVDPGGLLYRLGAGRGQILRSDPAAGVTDTLALDLAAGGVSTVSALAVDRRGRIYLGDGRNGNIAEYEPDGRLTRSWLAGPLVERAPISVRDLTFDGEGRLWALDPYNSALRCYDDSGLLLTGFTLPTEGAGSDFDPDRLAFDPGGNLTILGTSTYGWGDQRRILKFTPTGEYVYRWNFAVIEVGATCDAADLAWDSAGHLYLADGGAGCAAVRVYGY